MPYFRRPSLRWLVKGIIFALLRVRRTELA